MNEKQVAELRKAICTGEFRKMENENLYLCLLAIAQQLAIANDREASQSPAFRSPTV